MCLRHPKFISSLVCWMAWVWYTWPDRLVSECNSNTGGSSICCYPWGCHFSRSLKWTISKCSCKNHWSGFQAHWSTSKWIQYMWTMSHLHSTLCAHIAPNIQVCIPPTHCIFVLASACIVASPRCLSQGWQATTSPLFSMLSTMVGSMATITSCLANVCTSTNPTTST